MPSYVRFLHGYRIFPADYDFFAYMHRDPICDKMSNFDKMSLYRHPISRVFAIFGGTSCATLCLSLCHLYRVYDWTDLGPTPARRGVGLDDAFNSGNLPDMDRRTDRKSCCAEFIFMKSVSSINNGTITVFV